MLITYLLGMSEFLSPEVTYAPNRPLKNHICRLGIVFSQRLSSLPTEDPGVSLDGSFQLSKQIQVGLNVRCWQQAFISKQRCKTEKGVCTVIHFSFHYCNRSVNSFANLDRKLFGFPETSVLNPQLWNRDSTKNSSLNSLNVNFFVCFCFLWKQGY